MMHPFLLPSLLFFITNLAIAPSQAATYWVDSNSCSGRLAAGDLILTEAIKFAARAGVRNAKGSADVNQASVFQRLFKVPQSDTGIVSPPSMTTNESVQCGLAP